MHKKRGFTTPTRKGGGEPHRAVGPRQNGQRNNPKIIIQFFLCVVNTALFTALSDFTAFCAAPTAERKSRKSL